MSDREGFDYGPFTEQEANELRGIAQATRMALKRTLEDSLVVSENIKAAHRRLSGKGHGTFNAWCRAELRIDPSHAHNLMQLHDVLGRMGINSAYETVKTSPTVLIEIDRLPEPTRSLEIGRVREGEKRSLREVRGVAAAAAGAAAEGGSYRAPDRSREMQDFDVLSKARSYFAEQADDQTALRLSLKLQLAYEALRDLANDFEEMGREPVYEQLRTDARATGRMDDLSAQWSRVARYLAAVRGEQQSLRRVI